MGAQNIYCFYLCKKLFILHALQMWRRCCLTKKALCTARILDVKYVWSQILSTRTHKTNVKLCAARRSAYIFQMLSLRIFIPHPLAMVYLMHIQIYCKMHELLTLQVQHCVVMNAGHRVHTSSPLDPSSSKWCISFRHCVQNAEYI